MHDSNNTPMGRIYHVGRRGDLEFANPSEFDSFGKMPEAAVFVTTEAHIGKWAAYIGEMIRTVYLYEVEVPEGARFGLGRDGAERGDYKIVTNEPLVLRFVQALEPGRGGRRRR